MGNVVGSNIANVLLILGLAALLSPIVVSRKSFLRDGTALGLATAALVILAQIGEFNRLTGVLLLAGLAAYLVIAARGERVEPESAPEIGGGAAAASRPAYLHLAIAAAGIVLTVLGARFLVQGAIELAQIWGVSDAVIGLTIVAIGTSLPELVTSVMAAFRRQGDIAFGNVVGSNIYNILGILGATAVLKPIPVPAEIADFDIWIMLGATVGMAVVAITGWRANRLEGALLLAGYCGYVALIAMRNGVA